jgi:DNA polymerase I
MSLAEYSLSDPASLFRGRYMCAVARINHRGIPFDTETFHIILNKRETLRMEWIRKYDPNFEIFAENGKVSRDRWETYLEKRGKLEIWPKTEKTKRASYEEQVLRDMSAAGHIPMDLAELFYTVNLLKSFSLFVGEDGRNRVKWFNAYGTKTGRNAQRGYIYMMAKWVRSLIKPGPGMAVAYCDWNSMEVGVGAQMSRDPQLLEAYASGDAHMFLAKASAMVPPDAAKDAKTSSYACGPRCGRAECLHLPLCTEFANHVEVRSQFKTCDLAAMYGVSDYGLIKKGLTKAQARTTLRFHHDIYSVFWDWMSDQVETADIDGCTSTVLDWQMRVDIEGDRSPSRAARTVGNFFVQANSAEVMHLAAILAVELGLGIVAIVHDAFLLEAPIEDMQRQVTLLKQCMDEASAVVLDGFVLGVDGYTEDKWVVYPERYLDERGEKFWNEIQESLERFKQNGSRQSNSEVPGDLSFV